MIPIDTIVSIKSGDEYGGKYTGKLNIEAATVDCDCIEVLRGQQKEG